MPAGFAIPRLARPLALALALLAWGCAAAAPRPGGPESLGDTLADAFGEVPESLPVGVCAPPPKPLEAPAAGSPFAWTHPLPQGDNLLSVWGAGSRDLWAVGDRGRVLRFHAGAWRMADPGPDDYLAGVWGSGPGDVFVTGYNGRVLHYDGRHWQVHPTGVSNDFNGIWGSGPEDVFTVGDRGTILHYDGTCWRRQETGTDNLFFGVWGTGPDDVWAVGGRANAAHYDGTAWSVEDLGEAGAGGHYVGVWGTGKDNVYIVGSEGRVLHRAGGRWTREDVGTDALLRWAWGSGPNDVWVAGDEGQVRRFDGETWRPVPLPERGAVRGAWTAGPRGPTVLVGDDGMLLADRGAGFVSERRGVAADLFAVGGNWAGGADGILLFRGADDRWYPQRLPADGAVTALAELADGRVLAGGPGAMWLGDAKGWHALAPPPAAVNAMRAWGFTAVAVGEGGLALTWDGEAWRPLPVPTDQTLLGIGGAGPDDFWVVGEGGTALRHAGGAFTLHPVPGGEDLYGISDRGVAVGGFGGIHRFVDGAWRTLSPPGALGLYAAVDDGDVTWAVGDFGVVRRVEGDRVTPVAVPTAQTLWGAAVGLGGRLTLVGEGGTVLERPPAWGGVKIK